MCRAVGGMNAASLVRSRSVGADFHNSVGVGDRELVIIGILLRRWTSLGRSGRVTKVCSVCLFGDKGIQALHLSVFGAYAHQATLPRRRRFEVLGRAALEVPL
jgi:hypothetical protein